MLEDQKSLSGALGPVARTRSGNLAVAIEEPFVPAALRRVSNVATLTMKLPVKFLAKQGSYFTI